jgi:predicted amidophosphoribosyltransferase
VPEPSRQERCPSCHAPLRPGAPFCGQCGFDLPPDEPGAKPRPEKCPFCAAPVEGWEPTCEQCGLDLESDWQPASEDEARAVFNQAHRACTVCGELNPLTADFCKNCNAPVGNCVSMKPLEAIMSEGFIYRRCVTVENWSLRRLIRLAKIVLGIFFLANSLFLALCLIGAKFHWKWTMGNIHYDHEESFGLWSKWDWPLALIFAVLMGWLGFLLLRKSFGRRTTPTDDGNQPEPQEPTDKQQDA